MRYVRVPFRASIGVLRLTIAAALAAGLLAVALFAGTEAARADGPTQVNNCSSIAVSLVCGGLINGDVANVSVGDVNVLNGSQLNTLAASLGDVFLSVVNIQDINVLAFELNTAVQTWVNTVVNTITTITTKTCAPVVTPPVGTQGSVITITCS